MKLSILDIRLGAIYRIAARNQLSRQSIAALIHERAGFAPDRAARLAGHWVTTEPMRAYAA